MKPSLYADLYSNYRISGTPYLAYRDLPNILNEYVNGVNALDYGSGTGESTLFLKSLGYNVISTDINDKMLDIARKKDPSGKYLKIGSGALPFKEKTFDLVFCSFVLLEIETKKEILKVVSEICRVLNQGGIFISIASSKNTYNHEWLTLNTNFPENKNIKSGSKVKIEFRDFNLIIDDYFWSDQDYIEVFQNAGLNFIRLHNPLGRDDDGYEWKDEKLASPCSIIICQKQQF